MSEEQPHHHATAATTEESDEAMTSVAGLATSGRSGILPSQWLRRAGEQGVIDAGDYRILPENVQPGSLDLRLGEFAYRVRCSFCRPAGSFLSFTWAAPVRRLLESSTLQTA